MCVFYLVYLQLQGIDIKDQQGLFCFLVQHLMFMKQVFWITINYDIFMVPNLASWITFIYNLNCIHIHFNKINHCGGLTNMKCLDFLLTCSYNHVELMAINKNLSLTYSIVDSVAIIGILDAIKIKIFLKLYSHTNTLVLFIFSYNYNYHLHTCNDIIKCLI